MMKAIKLEIATPVHNRRDETLKCLESIANSNTAGIDIHIVVVDDFDGTAESIALDALAIPGGLL